MITALAPAEAQTLQARQLDCRPHPWLTGSHSSPTLQAQVPVPTPRTTPRSAGARCPSPGCPRTDPAPMYWPAASQSGCRWVVGAQSPLGAVPQVGAAPCHCPAGRRGRSVEVVEGGPAVEARFRVHGHARATALTPRHSKSGCPLLCGQTWMKSRSVVFACCADNSTQKIHQNLFSCCTHIEYTTYTHVPSCASGTAPAPRNDLTVPRAIRLKDDSTLPPCGPT